MKSRGFTLLELLVLIAMIGILVTAVVANMNKAKVRAFDVAARSCAHDIRTKEKLAQTRDGGFVPLSGLQSLNCTGLTPQGNATAAHFVSAVKHPRGAVTYTVTDSDLYTDGTGQNGAPLLSDAVQTGLDWENSGGVLAAPPPPTDPNGGTLGYSFVSNTAGTAFLNTQLRVRLIASDGKRYPFPLTTRPWGSGDVRVEGALPKLPPGAYTVEIQTPLCFNNYAGSVYCLPPKPGDVLTYTHPLTLARNQNTWVEGDMYWEVFWLYSSVTWHNGPSMTARNIGALQVLTLEHQDDPMRQDCIGECEKTDPRWKATLKHTYDLTAHWPNWVGSTNAPTSTTVRGLVAVRLVPLDANQPMDLSGLSLPNPMHFMLRPGQRGYLDIFTRTTGAPLTVGFRVDSDRFYTQRLSAIRTSTASR